MTEETVEGLIYNQQDIPKEQLRYGLRQSAATGCGWIAAYNALRLMGHRADPQKVIGWFEKNMPVVNGTLGTFVLTPAAFFKKLGFGVRVSCRRRDFDAMAKQADVCLLFYRWQKKWKGGAHYVALQYRDGSYYGYNTYRNSRGPDPYGPDLQTFLKKRGYYCAVLIAVTKAVR